MWRDGQILYVIISREKHIWPLAGQEVPSKAMNKGQGGFFMEFYLLTQKDRGYAMGTQSKDDHRKPPQAFQNHIVNSETCLVACSYIL